MVVQQKAKTKPVSDLRRYNSLFYTKDNKRQKKSLLSKFSILTMVKITMRTGSITQPYSLLLVQPSGCSFRASCEL